VTPQVDDGLTMAFDVSMGVAKKNTPLRDQLNTILKNHRAEIDTILDEYSVPRAAPATPTPKLQRFNPDHDDQDKLEVPGCCD
jgi:hypothetical protein